MKIDVSKLFRKKVQTLPFEVTSQLSTIDRDELKISLNSPLNVKGNAYFDGEVVTLVGTITTILKMQCSRCLTELDYHMSIEFEDEFSKFDFSEDRYLISEEETIDLTNMVTDNMILHLPVKVNCDENCKGLCPKCGKNLNKGLCSCTLEDVDPRLEVLKNLFKGD
ncbi:YceD family protein [Clostridium cylindrosporum]|uniref:Metal-binding protein n=1 Tax=Clostridium cylindrosporum DSM 605 TaxID=1121307 RepID=A0A0J8DAY6_CLOCY|nr:DUF177 domain-containing protein [Clostridium cylindrosporum]KMT21474.1 hypothetical protein CLCY_2c02340 [Clostridium cylindrosporum DSM 605]